MRFNNASNAACFVLGEVFKVGVDVADGLTHGGDIFSLLVRNFRLEFLFQRHDQLNGIQRIGAKVIHERGLGGDFLFLDAKLFDNDLFYALFNTAHV